MNIIPKQSYIEMIPIEIKKTKNFLNRLHRLFINIAKIIFLKGAFMFCDFISLLKSEKCRAMFAAGLEYIKQ
ncbi:MAG: hypothetical protein LBF71_01595 [Campylobacteraceae bacterium]|jgi:hypothetical protein|nr:hypothetical protein [Campylobacteraceae bacterium]